MGGGSTGRRKTLWEAGEGSGYLAWGAREASRDEPRRQLSRRASVATKRVRESRCAEATCTAGLSGRS